MRKTELPVLFIVLSILFYSCPASAQNIPPGNEPGSEASRYESFAEREKKALQKSPVKAPEIEVKEEAAPAAAPTGVSFELKEVVVTGSTVFKPEYFKPLYKDHIDKTVTFDDLDAIARNITLKYKERGYLTTIAYIPEQDITGGKVEIMVREGTLGDVRVEGNKWFPESLIRKYFHTKKNEILNIFKMSRDILRLNQNPDLEVKAVLGPGAEPGTSDITLKIDDKLPYHGGYGFDNQGTRLVGKDRNSFFGRSTSLLGMNDPAFVNTLMTATSNGTYASYDLPLNTYGLKAGFEATIFDNLLGREYKYADITSNTQIYTPHISGEIYLSEDFQANIESGFTIKSTKKWQQAEITSDDQLRMFYIAYDLTKMDAIFGGGQTTFSPRITFNTGGGFLGASKYGHPGASRQGTGGFFVKYEHSIRRIQKMPFDSYMSIRSQFQLASRTLPPSEQIQFGGANTVRGYPEGDYSADAGAVLNMDWIFPFYLVPKEWKLPHADKPFRDQVQPVVFMDLGGGKIVKKVPGERSDKFLMGVGGGLKIQFNKNVFMRLEWAERIGDRPEIGNSTSNFHISFQCEI